MTVNSCGREAIIKGRGTHHKIFVAQFLVILKLISYLAAESITILEYLNHELRSGFSLAIVRISCLRGCDTLNKPFEWTGRRQLSTSPPYTFCLPLKGSVGPSRCAADSTAQDYHQAFYNRSLNTIADPAPSPTAMPAQHQLHSF
jgi:hypothetical protein